MIASARDRRRASRSVSLYGVLRVRYRYASALSASETDRARVHARTAPSPSRAARTVGAIASATAATMLNVRPRGAVTSTCVASVANTAPTMARINATVRQVMMLCFRLLAICDHWRW
jgi:hypothetical protein